MANALANESSPYLLQHRDNPVDWLPWGDEALERARSQDKPLLVSIGYSACHWCHVMERESFEDEGIAALMNEHFVCVKVDREERPDIDAIYMDAVQQLTGQGGWPLNVFLAPDQTPFYGGTYFPPQPRHGLPSWANVLQQLADAWENKRDDINVSGEQLRARIAVSTALRPSDKQADTTALDDAVRNLATSYDERHGGFGGAPKFPSSCVLGFLLTQADARTAWSERAQEMTLGTLSQMARGGIYDQAGGGFARYAVDRTWTVPHFEKMLYDNALLLRAYARAFQVSGDDLFQDTAIGIGDWALREMRGPEGAFFSAIDADSEGVEGRFYVWTPAELSEALGDLHDTALRWLTTAEFEGKLILEAHGDRAALTAEQRAEIRTRLLAARSARVWPQTDTKRLASWNWLMIGALAEAGAALGRPEWVAAAAQAADFVLTSMRDSDGRLLRTSDGQTAKLNAYLEDHAFAVEGLLDLYEATFDSRWFVAARELADTMIERFADTENGGFFSTSSDHEQLLTRRKDLDDNPIPSGSSSAALGLLRLAAFTGEHRYEEQAVGVLRLLQELALRHPQAFGHLLQALDFHLRPTQEVALAGQDVSAFQAALRTKFRPHVVVAGPPGDGVPLMEGREPVGGEAAAYVCERFVCKRPVTDIHTLISLLDDTGGG
jgi:uncharacterized protein YyaL (SSP411 family)